MIFFLYHKIIVKSNQEPLALFGFSCALPSFIYNLSQNRVYRIRTVVSFSLGNILGSTFRRLVFCCSSPFSIGVLVNG